MILNEYTPDINLPLLQIETLREALELWIPYYIPKNKEFIIRHCSNNTIHLIFPKIGKWILSKPWDNDPLLLLVKLHLESHHRFSFLLLDAYSHQNIKNANVHLPQLMILQGHVGTKFWQALLWRMTAHTFWPKVKRLFYSSI